MGASQYQFTVRSLLWTTFWAAAAVAAFIQAIEIERKHSSGLGFVVAVGFAYCGPLLAILPLFGRKRLSIVLVICIWLIWTVALMFPPVFPK